MWSGISFYIPWSCIFKWGSFMQNAKTLSGKALRAMHQLWQLLKDVESPLHISFNLFYSLVESVINYGSEVLGFMHAECIERVHRKFCKYMLNVKKKKKLHE